MTDSHPHTPVSWRERWRWYGRVMLIASIGLGLLLSRFFSPDSFAGIFIGILFWAGAIALVVSLIGERPRYALGEIIFLVGLVVWLGASVVLTLAGLGWWFDSTPWIVGILLFPVAAPPAVFLFPFYKLLADGNPRPLLMGAVGLLAVVIIIPIGRRLRLPPGASLFP